MKSFPINRLGCGPVQLLSDAFVDHELVAETSIEIIRHVTCCNACKSRIEDVMRVRSRLRSAVQGIEAPASLSRTLSRPIRTCEPN